MNTSSTLHIPRSRRVDPVALDVLRQVDKILQELSVEYFVIGAIARDLLLAGVFGLMTGRATGDVDLGIVVDGWPQFEAIQSCLVGTGVFIRDEKRAQRLYHRPKPKGASYPLDLIPFGGVERHPNEIAWPPDGSEIMNVAGFGEAISSAVRVEVEPGFVVRVASMPGLAIMKILAWVDRGTADRRDASDLAMILQRYADAENEDRLFGADVRVLERTNYDFNLAGARLLGGDAGRIAAPATRVQVLALLDDPARKERLTLDVSRELRTTEDSVARANALLAEFHSGFLES